MHWLFSPPPDCIPEHPARPPPHEDVQSCRKVQQTLLWAALRIPAWLIFILSQHWVSCRGDTGFPHEMAARLLSHLLCSPQLLIIRQTCPRQASPPPCLCCCCSCGRRSGFGFSAPVRTCSGVSCVFWGRVSFELQMDLSQSVLKVGRSEGGFSCVFPSKVKNTVQGPEVTRVRSIFILLRNKRQ